MCGSPTYNQLCRDDRRRRSPQPLKNKFSRPKSLKYPQDSLIDPPIYQANERDQPKRSWSRDRSISITDEFLRRRTVGTPTNVSEPIPRAPRASIIDRTLHSINQDQLRVQRPQFTKRSSSTSSEYATDTRTTTNRRRATTTAPTVITEANRDRLSHQFATFTVQLKVL